MDDETKELFELKAEILGAAAHPTRLAIIELLRDGEQCVCDIAEQVGAKRSNVSRHLAVMLKAGILEHRKDGLRVMYALKTPCMLDFLSCVSDVLRERLRVNKALLARL